MKNKDYNFRSVSKYIRIKNKIYILAVNSISRDIFVFLFKMHVLSLLHPGMVTDSTFPTSEPKNKINILEH